MPQTFQVLKCYECLVFQVIQTKKSNKWECKMCGVKQSIKRHYGIGNGKECRLHVQKLNGLRGNLDDLKTECSDNEIEFETNTAKFYNNNTVRIQESKWVKYDTSENELTQPALNENLYLKDTEAVLKLHNDCSNKTFSSYKESKKLNLSKINKCGVGKAYNQTVKNPDKNVNSMYYGTKFPESSIKQSIPKEVLTSVKKESKWSNFIETESDDDKPSDNNENLLSYDKLTSLSFTDNTISVDASSILSGRTKISPNMVEKDFVLSPSSKKDYSQFNSAINSNGNITTSKDENLYIKKGRLSFSLCDDSDLDELLNI